MVVGNLGVDQVGDLCGKNGKCKDGTDGPHCICDQKYTGTYCDILESRN